MDIIENPITIGKIQIANKDFPKPMNLQEAIDACKTLGDGWRLPTLDELVTIYENKDKIGSFNIKLGLCNYWSSTPYGHDNEYNYLDFRNGKPHFISMHTIFSIRAVNSL